MMRHLMWAPALCSIVAATTCAGSEGNVEDECMTDERMALSNEPEWEIGPLAFEPTPSVAWLGDSAVALVDVHDQQVVVLGLDGGERRRIGRKGGGPGEFTGANGLLSGPDGLLVAEAFRISHFDADLRLEGTHRAPGLLMSLLAWRGDEVSVLWVGAGPGGMRPQVGALDLATGAWEDRIDLFAADSALEAPLPMGAGTSPFVLATGLPDGDLVVGQPITYRLVRMDPRGGVRRVFGRDDLERQRPTEGERARQRQRMLRMFEMSPTPLPEGAMAMLDGMLDAPRPFFRLGFHADAEERIWVITGRGGDDRSEIDVFGGDGGLLSTLSLPHAVRAVATRLPHVAVLVERRDAPVEGQGAVHVFRLVGGEACASPARGGP